MRKISFIMAALALVLGVTQCKKENKPLASGETQRIVLTASNGNDGSKVAVNETTTMLNLTWQDTDKIAASGAVEGTLAYKSDVEPGTATFEGSVTRKEGNEVTFSIGSAPESFEGQTGDVTWIHDHLYLKSDAVPYNDEGVYGEEDQEVEMKLQYAVLKLDLSALGTEAGTTVTISNASGPVATVAGVKTTAKTYYVAMPAAESTTYTFSGNDKSVEKTWTLENNIFYTMNNSGDAILVEPYIQGNFTVGMVGDKPKTVEFAPGNLWYGKAVGETTAAFHFEENQWDYSVGDFYGTQGSHNQQMVYYWNPDHVSHFLWSEKADIAVGTNTSLVIDGDSDMYDTFFTNANDFQVAGEEAGTWRILNQDECAYLLEQRTNAANLCAMVTLTDVVTLTGESVQGLVILPDGNGIASAVTTAEKVASSGAVFLPCAGIRGFLTGIDKVLDVFGWGAYWSSPDQYDSASTIEFWDGIERFVGSQERTTGYAVRLVRDVK